MKREFEMFVTIEPTRQAAISLAAAFLSALLFVSAAVGPLPLV